jgi:hypothetical protein
MSMEGTIPKGAEEDVIDITENDAVPIPTWWKDGPFPVFGDLKVEANCQFASIDVVKAAVKYLAVKHRFPYCTKQTNASRYEVGCSLLRDNDVQCTFHIKARVQGKLGGKAIIIKSDLVHSCGCLYTNSRQIKGLGTKFVCDQAEGFLADCPKATAKHIVSHIKRTIGADVNYRTAHRGKKLITEEMAHSEVMLFQYIDPYFQKIVRKMPGSVAVMERDPQDDTLLRRFVML